MRKFARSCLTGTVLAVFCMAVITIVSPSSLHASSPSKQFKNCKQLRDLYIYGVAKNRSVVGTSHARVNKNIYTENRRLDFDNDGIVCEYENIQYPPTTTTSTTTTTTTMPPTTTTTIARTPPSGNWDGQYLYDKNALFLGYGYMHAICTSGSATKILSLWENVNANWIKKADSYPITGDSWCPDPAYPVKHRFYWVPDWLGIRESSKRNSYLLQLKVTGLTSDTFYTRTIYPSESLMATDLANLIRCAFGETSYC